MSEEILGRNELWSSLPGDKCFDFCDNSDEKEVQVDHYGLSAIRPNSGFICLICMKFFLNERAAHAHAKDFLHYQKYCNVLLCVNDIHFRRGTTQKGHFLVEYPSLETDFEIQDPPEEREETINNEELQTIKECAGIVCEPCRKFFVDEASAHQHVKSLSHYRKCYDLLEDVPQELEEKVALTCNSDQMSFKEEKANLISSDVLHMDKTESTILNGFNNYNSVDLQINIKESKNSCEKDTGSQNSETTESNLDSLILDNDWWSEFDQKLGSLLHDIDEECGEELKL